MALNDLLLLSKTKKIGVSEERLIPVLDELRKAFSFYREYPDLFIDFIAGPDSTFSLYFYQRVFLRAVMRHKYAYCTFPRAYSKSFLTIMALMMRCIFYPGAKLFITSGGKEQAASIAKEKIEEILDLLPALRREINYSPGKTTFSKDYVKLEFRNKSRLDIVAARDSARGGRRHGGAMEEVILIDGEALNNVILPLMNVSRIAKNGEVDPEESLNKSQIYITTAGYKNTFSYDKLIQILIWQIVNPKKAITLGGTWRIPVKMKLLDRSFIKDLKMDGTFNEASFDREYESIWSGSSAEAYFNSQVFEKHRILNQPEYKRSERSSKNAYYVLSVDVGRKGCSSVICVFKVTPQPQAASLKSLVNIYAFDEEHFEDQAIKIKKLFYTYGARRLVIDGNGLGIGLLDYMVKSQIDPDTQETLPDFGIENDEENYYKKYKNANTQEDAIFIIKANAPLNTIIYSTTQSQLASGRIKMLIDERTAKNKMMSTKVGLSMSSEERAEHLKPFVMTSILREEMMNLKEDNDGQNIILKQINRGIKLMN